MSDPERHILLNPDRTEMHTAIGRAVENYARVEAAVQEVLRLVLGIDHMPAAILFDSVLNVRARSAMIDALLKNKYGVDTYKPFWSSCSKFLKGLADFRNAIVHWQPVVVLWVDDSGKSRLHNHALSHPVPGKGRQEGITPDDIEPFIQDCRFIFQEIASFARHLEGEPPPSPDKYRQPLIRRNVAVIQPPPMPKEREPQHPPFPK